MLSAAEKDLPHLLLAEEALRLPLRLCLAHRYIYVSEGWFALNFFRFFLELPRCLGRSFSSLLNRSDQLDR